MRSFGRGIVPAATILSNVTGATEMYAAAVSLVTNLGGKALGRTHCRAISQPQVTGSFNRSGCHPVEGDRHRHGTVLQWPPCSWCCVTRQVGMEVRYREQS